MRRNSAATQRCLKTGEKKIEMRLPLRSFPRCLLLFPVAMLLLTGCEKHTAEQSSRQPARRGPSDPNLSVSPAGYHGRHYSGPVYLPRYSPMNDGTTAYDVLYQNDVLVIGKQDTRRHLLTIHPDGDYAFDATAEQIARLKPDDIVLLSGLALRTVVEVQQTETGYLLKTSPAKITDAIKSGRLEGKYNIDFSRMRNIAEYDVNFSGFNYHVKFTPGADRVYVQATIKYAGSQGAVAYEGSGYLNNFLATIRIQIKDGQVTSLDFLNSKLAGQASLKWYAAANDAMRPGAMAKITSWPAELYKDAQLTKAAYDVPVVLGALPFDLRISLGFSFIPEFTSQNSMLEGSKLIKFGGSGGFHFLNGQTKGAGSFNVDGKIDGQDSAVEATGPVGFTAATEAPRIDLGLGWPPAPPPIAGYLNFVTSYGIVTNGSVNPAPCQTNIMAFSVNAGAAYSSPNTFANWPGTEPGTASSVSLWSKTFKSPGPHIGMCPG